jgi:hypothetical protein
MVLGEKSVNWHVDRLCYVPDGFVVLCFGRSSFQESILTDSNAIFGFSDSQDWESNLENTNHRLVAFC